MFISFTFVINLFKRLGLFSRYNFISESLSMCIDSSNIYIWCIVWGICVVYIYLSNYLISVNQHLQESCRGMEPGSALCCWSTGQEAMARNWCTLKFHLNTRKNFFTGHDHTRNRLPRESLPHWRFPKLSAHNPECCEGLCLSREVGLDDLQWSLTTSPILWGHVLSKTSEIIPKLKA